MAEDVACDNHIGFISVYGDAVHAQKLRQQRGTVTFHNKLRERNDTTTEKSMIHITEAHMQRLITQFIYLFYFYTAHFHTQGHFIAHVKREMRSKES